MTRLEESMLALQTELFLGGQTSWSEEYDLFTSENDVLAHAVPIERHASTLSYKQSFDVED